MPPPDSAVSRRSFVRAAGAASLLTAAGWARVAGANERVGVGFIGFGLIGKRHVLDFQEQPDVTCVAVAEVHRGRLDEARAQLGTAGWCRSARSSAPGPTTGGRTT